VFVVGPASLTIRPNSRSNDPDEYISCAVRTAAGGILMTGLYDRKPGDVTVEPAVDPLLPDHLHGHDHGVGAEAERPVLWERWQKKRTFVRALEGTYSDLTQSLLNQPRVYSSRSMPWKGGPQVYGKHVI
jgi:hypothetical protein